MVRRRLNVYKNPCSPPLWKSIFLLFNHLIYTSLKHMFKVLCSLHSLEFSIICHPSIFEVHNLLKSI